MKKPQASKKSWGRRCTQVLGEGDACHPVMGLWQGLDWSPPSTQWLATTRMTGKGLGTPL